MAKRATGEDYSPVRAALTRFREPRQEPQHAPEAHRAEQPPAIRFDTPATDVPPALPARAESTPLPEVAPPAMVEESEAQSAGRLTERIRIPVTPEEHELWHDLAHRVTGKRQNLACLMRAAWSLIEHAEQQLEARKNHIAALKRPAKEKHLERALYEQRIAQQLYDGIKAAGRPPEHLLKRQ